MSALMSLFAGWTNILKADCQHGIFALGDRSDDFNHDSYDTILKLFLRISNLILFCGLIFAFWGQIRNN